MRPDDSTPVPFGFCQCGCGRRTSIAKCDRPEYGHRKGEPVRFIRGHWQRKSGQAFIVDPETGCWNWQLAKNRQGYGMCRVPGDSNRLAHRVYYARRFGPIPAGMAVLHACDNPSCVNPDHLSLGSLADNNHDRDAKGHQVTHRGSGHHAAVIDEETATLIRKRHAAGERQTDIANSLGISRTIVWEVVHRKTWRHLP